MVSFSFNTPKTGISTSALNNLCNNKTSSVQFSVLDKICTALDCKVSDILSPEKCALQSNHFFTHENLCTSIYDTNNIYE